ncbi:MAG: LysR family transcriptional regulator [Bilifractor sp.]
MTLNQLKYAVMVAECSSITEAARRLFLTQPSLTASIHELEKELKISIFSRTNKGITVTADGEEFLGYARQILEQEEVMRERFTGKNPGKEKFCVSGQHYSFVVEAFVDLINRYGGEEYEFHLRETQTWQILEDVAHGRSSVGVLYMNQFNKAILTRDINEHGLVFTRLFRAEPHVFVSKFNPLATRKSVTMEDLDIYPRLSYEQGEHNSFYYAEEIQSPVMRKKDIVVTDRATLFNLLIGMNGYTISSGVINAELNGDNIVAVPLAVDDYMDIGYVLRRHMAAGRLASYYLNRLRYHTQQPDKVTSYSASAGSKSGDGASSDRASDH